MVRINFHAPVIGVVTILAMFTPASGSAQGGIPQRDTGAAAAPLRLSDVFESLKRHSPRVQAASALALAAHFRISGAGLPPDPELQLGWMNFELPSLKPMDVLGMKQIQLMQMVPIPGKLRLSRSVARSRAAAEDDRAQNVWWEARAEAAMPFYEIYRADRSLAVMRETLRLLGDVRANTEGMYRVGSGNQADVLRAQLEIARMTEDTLRMSAMRAAMAARLNAILDRPQESPVASPVLPAFPNEIPALDSLVRLAYSARPMIGAGAADLAAATSMERLARKELVPDIRVGVQYAQRGSALSGTERMGSVMVGATIPLYARSRQLRLREEAAAMRQMAASDLAAMRANTRGALGERLADLARARRLAELYRNTILPQARAAVSSAQAAYRVGRVDFLTLLDDQMTVNKYALELVALEAEEGRAWADLEMLTGTALIDSAAPSTSNNGADQ